MTSIDMLSPPLSVPHSTAPYDLSCADSGTHSSRSGDTTTTDDSGRVDFQHYLDSPRSSPSLTSHSTSTVSSSSSYLSPLLSNYLPTPAPAVSPFPGLSPEILNGEWDDKNTRIHESPEPYECSQSESAPPDTGAAVMSAAALSLDSSFSMSGKESFPWPGMMASTDASANLLGHELSMGPASDGGYSPTGRSRSANSSPPRQPLSAEQRELKRQMDQARRESKSAARFRRSNSNPYLADTTTSALNVPAYTSSAPPISLLAEPATSNVPGQSYLSPYSQPLQEPDSSGLSGVPMYGAPMQHQQSLQPTYNVPLDFPQTYHQQPSSSYQQPSPSYSRSRPASVSVGSDSPSLFYPVPNVITPTTNGPPVSSPPEQHHVRMVQGRPKPQCWEHGCNGRQFSTFSNLLRHQREKSGQASKATCPNCGAEFTRTTARNGHLMQGKCKKRSEETAEGQPRQA